MSEPDEPIERMLRDWAAEQRAHAASTVQLPDVPRRSEHRGRWTVAAAAAAVLAVAVGLALGFGGHVAERHSQPPARQSSTPRRTAPPPGTQEVTYHHLAIWVPAAWPLGNEYCGSAQHDTVLLPVAELSCLAPIRADTWVQFQPPTASGLLDRKVRWHPSEVDGRPATRASETRSGRYMLAITVPSAVASVYITSTDRAEADRLADTLRVVDVDAHGCPVEQAYEPLGRTPPATVAGAARSLVPGQPSSLTVCAYDPHLLLGSGVAPATRLAADLAVLRALPRGLSVAPGATNDFACTETQDLSAALDRDDALWYLILARYQSGAILRLHVRTGLCGYLGVSNGLRTGRWSRSLVELVTRTSQIGAAFPERTRPAP